MIAAVRMLGRVRACFGLGDSERTDPLAADRGQQIVLPLLSPAGREHFIYLAEDVSDQSLRRLAELLFDQAHVDGAKTPTAHLGRHVHGKEAELDGLGLEGRQHLGRQALPRLHLLFKGLDLGFDEPSNGIHQQAGFLGNVEIDHDRCGSRVRIARDAGHPVVSLRMQPDLAAPGILMPIVQIFALEGRTVKQKRELVRAVTRSVCEAIAVPPEDVQVVILDTPRESWATAGILASDGSDAESGKTEA